LIGIGPAHGTRAPFIVGGSPAAAGSAPWATHIEIRTPNRVAICAASLIAESWLLTAGHCVTDDRGSVLSNAAVRAMTGVVDRRSAPPSALRFVDRIAVSGYNAGAGTGDWALLRLTEPVTSGAVRLARLRDMADLEPGSPLHVTGWGVTSEDGELSPVLNEAIVPLIEEASCAVLLGPLFVPDAMLCAGMLAGGVDSCSGDSGAALTAVDRRGLPVEVGIVSFGVGCARPGLPGVYTRVARYVDEIVAVLRADPRAPARDPGVLSSDAATLTRQSSRITATVDTGGLAAAVDMEFGRSTAYVRTASVRTEAGGVSEAEVVLSGLEPGVLYHYRVLVETAAGVATGPDRTFRAGQDEDAPAVHALPSSGAAGGLVRLRYDVDDAIGRRTRERVTVRTRAGAHVATLSTRFGRDGVTRSVAWRAAGVPPGRYRFCVVAHDEAGNGSKASCASLRLR
jgi:secreted trypsin-like serine protease